MNQIPVKCSTWKLSSKKLNFSVSFFFSDTLGIIEHRHLTNALVRVGMNPKSSKRYTVSSYAINTDELHLTIFSLTKLNLYTVLLPFDNASWFCLSLLILAIITFTIDYNRRNFYSAQTVILWMLRNVFEQDDETTTKHVCSSKTTTKYVIILWSLCSMFIGWSYKACVSSEISIQFPSSIPNSMQEILDTNTTIISTGIFGIYINDESKQSELQIRIENLLRQQRYADYSPEYLHFLSSLNRKVHNVQLHVDQFECSITQRITRLRNSSNVLDSWSMFTDKEHTNWLTALMDTCSPNFTSVTIRSNPNKFQKTLAWAGLNNNFLKIFSNKLSVVTQSGLYGYWETDYFRKKQVHVWKNVIRSNTINGEGNSPDALNKAKAVLRNFLDIKLINKLFDLRKLTYQVKILKLSVHAKLRRILQSCYNAKIKIRLRNATA